VLLRSSIEGMSHFLWLEGAAQEGSDRYNSQIIAFAHWNP
jgi:hypothetical protein